ncbi:MAG: hypothetical protein ACTS3F_02590 [Phycisphaerales bacterium]
MDYLSPPGAFEIAIDQMLSRIYSRSFAWVWAIARTAAHCPFPRVHLVQRVARAAIDESEHTVLQVFGSGKNGTALNPPVGATMISRAKTVSILS